MSNKTVSKDVREYWKMKLLNKFSSRKSDLETLHTNQINKLSEKNLPAFKKNLKLEPFKKALEKSQVAYQSFIKSQKDTERKLLDNFEKAIENYSQHLDSWAVKRHWSTSLPNLEHLDRDDKEHSNLVEKFEKAIKEVCYAETKKQYIESEAGEELKKLADDKERAMDILHSDMMPTEWLQAIQGICKSAHIACSIPLNDIKQLSA